jgi:hypothetical protein
MLLSKKIAFLEYYQSGIFSVYGLLLYIYTQVILIVAYDTTITGTSEKMSWVLFV